MDMVDPCPERMLLSSTAMPTSSPSTASTMKGTQSRQESDPDNGMDSGDSQEIVSGVEVAREIEIETTEVNCLNVNGVVGWIVDRICLYYFPRQPSLLMFDFEHWFDLNLF